MLTWYTPYFSKFMRPFLEHEFIAIYGSTRSLESGMRLYLCPYTLCGSEQ